MDGDRPISEISDDALGLNDYAHHLAEALQSGVLREGFVIAIEGPWGSGKTSLIRLALDQLPSRQSVDTPLIVEFRPWLVGDRDSLLSRLFDDLARTIDRSQAEAGDLTGTSMTKAKDTAAKLRAFGKKLSPLQGLASLADLAGIPFAGTAKAALEGLSGMLDTPDADRPLAEFKDHLDKELRELQRRIVVVIDDLDRLEPLEILEVLRLVRSVADFPNVVYLLSYDSKIVERAIVTAAGIENGRAYLEKIVQLQLAVPEPEAFALRRMFSRRLETILGELSYEVASRLTLVVDRWGGLYLKSPRSVVRTLDSIRYAWGALASKVDPADLVWLHLVKVGNPDLYDWVGSYLSAIAATRTLRASIDDAAKKKSLAALESALEKDGRKREEELIWLDDILPAISCTSFGDDKMPLFQPGFIPADRFRDRRLASPDHYRLYFATSLPAGAPREEQITALLSAAKQGEGQALTTIRSWLADEESANRASAILNRIRHVWLDSLDKEQAQALISAVAMVADDPPVARESEFVFGRPSIWAEGEELLKGIRGRFRGSAVAGTELFKNGAALGWMTDLLRSETFDHGRFGDRRRPEQEWLYSDSELDQIIAIMHARYARLSLPDILKLPVPANVFYAWEQSGGGDEVRAFLRKATRGHGPFVEFMKHAYNRSSGNYRAIERESFEKFMNYDEARARIEGLAKRRGRLQEDAANILQQFVNGEEKW